MPRSKGRLREEGRRRDKGESNNEGAVMHNLSRTTQGVLFRSREVKSGGQDIERRGKRGAVHVYYLTSLQWAKSRRAPVY